MLEVDSTPLLIVISAPSGGGKTTLCHRLLAASANMTRAITCTTRAPRPGEKDGVDYYFLEPAAFSQRVEAASFLEHATVYGHSYGTLKAEVLGRLRDGRDVLLNVDVQEAAIRFQAEQQPELKQALVTVFITPNSLSVLEERLRKRGQNSEVSIQVRLSVARQEIAQCKNFDYLIISTTIEEDLRRMQVILAAERMRQNHAKPPLLE